GQERRHWERKATRAMRSSTASRASEPDFGRLPGQLRIKFYFRWIAASLLGRTAHDVKQRNGVDSGANRGEEAVGQAASAAGGRFRVATDDDRYRFRDRLRIAADFVEFHELAGEAGTVVRPQCALGRNTLVGTPATTLERNTECLELLF